MDVYTPNSANGISNSRDKLRSLQILSKHDIGIPLTAFVRDRKDRAFRDRTCRRSAPVVIKVLEGTQGIGVILAETNKVAEAIIETLHGAKQNVLIQQFVAESKGKDVRAFVVGDRVVAAMRRVAQGTEFRSNVHRGGRTEAITLTPEYEETAVRAAQILGLRVAGVDLLESNSGPQVMEVNSSPGLEGIEGATKLDIAGVIIDYMAERVDFPDIDVRQRLTVSANYGVAEINIPEGSDMIGKSIEDTGLRDKDISVLTLNRANNVISNPKSTRELEANDRLLCYGKLDSMRGLIPEKRQRKRKPKVQKLDPGLINSLEDNA